MNEQQTEMYTALDHSPTPVIPLRLIGFAKIIGIFYLKY